MNNQNNDMDGMEELSFNLFEDLDSSTNNNVSLTKPTNSINNVNQNSNSTINSLTNNTSGTFNQLNNNNYQPHNLNNMFSNYDTNFENTATYNQSTYSHKSRSRLVITTLVSCVVVLLVAHLIYSTIITLNYRKTTDLEKKLYSEIYKEFPSAIKTGSSDISNTAAKVTVHNYNDFKKELYNLLIQRKESITIICSGTFGEQMYNDFNELKLLKEITSIDIEETTDDADYLFYSIDNYTVDLKQTYAYTTLNLNITWLENLENVEYVNTCTDIII